MQEAVSGILVGRRREVDGLSRMITVSLAVHATVLALLFVIPPGWLTSEPEPRGNPITISLGLPPGKQDTGGMTSIASAPAQAVSTDARATVTPPAAKVPEMVVPTEVKPKPAVKPVEKPIDKSTTRKPATGPELKTGSARVATPDAADVKFGGLASGGGGTGGVRTEGNFCCPEYIEQMKSAIYRNWDRGIGVQGMTEVKFTIRRDGVLVNVAVEKPSGNPLLDLESRKAVLATQKVAPLPERYTEPTLVIYLTFEYSRR